MRFHIWHWALIAASVMSAGTVQLLANGSNAAPSEMKILWTIGVTDRGSGEFALGPGGWREYRKASAEMERLRQDLVGSPASNSDGKAA